MYAQDGCMRLLLGVHREWQDSCTVVDQEDETNFLYYPIPHSLGTYAVPPDCRSEILRERMIRFRSLGRVPMLFDIIHVSQQHVLLLKSKTRRLVFPQDGMPKYDNSNSITT